MMTVSGPAKKPAQRGGGGANVPRPPGLFAHPVSSFYSNLLLLFFEFALGGSTHGTNPLIGQIFECGSCGDAILRVTFRRIVDITTCRADVFVHSELLPVIMMVEALL